MGYSQEIVPYCVLCDLLYISGPGAVERHRVAGVSRVTHIEEAVVLMLMAPEAFTDNR